MDAQQGQQIVRLDLTDFAERTNERADMFRLRRESLYEAVWTYPLTRLAEVFGVSDVAVKKWCRKLDIPVPGRG